MLILKNNFFKIKNILKNKLTYVTIYHAIAAKLGRW
jgi:hypothetical protein